MLLKNHSVGSTWCLYEGEKKNITRGTLTFADTPQNLSVLLPPYPRVIHSKNYRGYVKPQIIPNAI
jgi:hypothetical protein